MYLAKKEKQFHGFDLRHSAAESRGRFISRIVVLHHSLKARYQAPVASCGVRRLGLDAFHARRSRKGVEKKFHYDVVEEVKAAREKKMSRPQQDRLLRCLSTVYRDDAFPESKPGRRCETRVTRSHSRSFAFGCSHEAVESILVKLVCGRSGHHPRLYHVEGTTGL